ncbi:MAG: M50 family metallopeptidase [Ancrocorticia populi]|uniref:M50 family metallopeptidase n=1 Tax=Ancrocorticia populi TaxID=2175228 RepID=UPI003F910BF2
MDLWREFATRLEDSVRGFVVPDSPWLLTGIVAAAVIVMVPFIWRHLRQIVTVVHELGHAVVGVACGRSFTGFVVNSDMSGHTLTTGKSRGIGLILTMYAGYPMPAIVGGAILFAALSGRAGLVLVIAFGLMVVALIRSKSGYTVVILLLLLVGTGWVWWTNDPELSATVVSAVGIILLVGAWRQFGSVVMSGGRQSDPAQLARITPLPTFFWNLLMLVPIGLASWWAAGELIPVIQGVVS